MDNTNKKLIIASTPIKFPLGEGVAWEWFETGCLPKGMTMKDHVTFVDVTKAPAGFERQGNKLLVLGPDAFKILFPGISLEKSRGTLLSYNGVQTSVSFHPQDADDPRAVDEEDETFASNDSDKDSALTSKLNYRFWIRADTRKFLAPIFPAYHAFKYHVAPNLQAFLKYTEPFTKGGHRIYIDIETDPEDWSLNCIGLAIDDSPVFVIPVYDYTNRLQYGQMYKLMARLSVLMARNEVIAHNIQFDLFMLAYFHRVLFNKQLFDTMVAHHRLFPEVEKSLGHVISYWTWLPFHKDQNIFRPRTVDQQHRLYKYNALDVYALREVHLRILAFLKDNPERAAAVIAGNRAIYPYLCASLEGILVDDFARVKALRYKGRVLKQWLRIAKNLKGDKLFNPNSTKQCVDYFHGQLKYKVQGYTKTGEVKLDAKNLYKLRLMYPNPLLDLVVRYRFLVKERSGLEFIPYEKPAFK